MFIVDDNGTMLDGIAMLLLVVAMLRDGGDDRPAGEQRPARSRGSRKEHGPRVEVDEGVTRRADGSRGDAVTCSSPGAPDGALIFPEFLPAPDGMTTLAKILEFRAQTGTAAVVAARAAAPGLLRARAGSVPVGAEGQRHA